MAYLAARAPLNKDLSLQATMLTLSCNPFVKVRASTYAEGRCFPWHICGTCRSYQVDLSMPRSNALGHREIRTLLLLCSALVLRIVESLVRMCCML